MSVIQDSQIVLLAIHLSVLHARLVTSLIMEHAQSVKIDILTAPLAIRLIVQHVKMGTFCRTTLAICVVLSDSLAVTHVILLNVSLVTQALT